jgi:hypothetical protein
MILIRRKKVMRILTIAIIFDSGLANVKGDKAAENLMIYVGTEGTWYVRGSLTRADSNHASLPGYWLSNLAVSLSLSLSLSPPFVASM